MPFEAAGGSGVSESSAAALEAAVANINKNLPDGAQLQQTAAEIQLQLNTALALGGTGAGSAEQRH